MQLVTRHQWQYGQGQRSRCTRNTDPQHERYIHRHYEFRARTPLPPSPSIVLTQGTLVRAGCSWVVASPASFSSASPRAPDTDAEGVVGQLGEQQAQRSRQA